MFVYGAQYLRGATPERDQWEKDIIKMKELGFNTIRAWLVWNAIEKQEGVIDEDYLNEFLSIAQKHDMYVGLLFHLHAAPAWAIEKYPQYYYVNEHGEAFMPSTRPNTPSGGWPGLCFDHDEVRELEKRFIEKVIAVTKKYSCVAFYEPMNEPHQWVDDLRTYDSSFCYCHGTEAKYRKWLKKEYSTIENLNDTWGTYYTSFAEIHPPRWLTGYGETIDFRRFTMDNIAEEVEYRTQIIKKCDTKPVVAHAFGGGSVNCAMLGAMAFDDWKNASVVDKWGFSAFPFSDDECCSLALSSNAERCAANGKEYWQSELGAGIVGTGIWPSGRIDDKMFAKFAVTSISYGAKGMLYWQFRKERIGTEFGGFALSDYNGGDTNLSLSAAKLAKAIKENEKVFESVKPPKAKIALVMSIRSMLADWCNGNRMDNKFSVDSMSGYYKMFWEENIPIDILHEDFYENIYQYKLIILPCAFAISEEFAQELRKFIENGGMVLSEPYFGVFDGKYKLARCVPGFGYDRVFGLEEDDMRRTEELKLYKDGKEYLISGNRHMEKFKNVSSEVLYSYDDGSAAIVKNNFKKGAALITGVNLGLSYSPRTLICDGKRIVEAPHHSPAAKGIVFDICGVNELIKNPCNKENIICSFGYSDDNCNSDLLFVVNNNKEKASGNIVCEKSYEEAEVIYGRADVNISGNTIKFIFDADETVIIKLNKCAQKA